MRFEGKTLEEVYEQISRYFNKSISELKIELIQSPTNGIFGFFAKPAILEVEDETIINKEVEKKIEEDIVNKIEEKIESEINEEKEKVKNEIKTEIEEEIKKTDEIEIKKEESNSNSNLSIEEVVELAKKELKELFSLSCFKMDKIDVKVYDDETILFELDGEDSALLIGKEGYRYNALASMLFSWISQKYGYKTKLEISSFLENQEEMMRKFLEPTIREIEEKGRCKTKTFDGVLVYIAVEILRAEFPHKYVAIKRNRDDSQYIIVNDFLKKNG